MSEYMTAKDFAAKVGWEGGIEEALDYGLKHTHLDPEDKTADVLWDVWRDMEDKWAEFTELRDKAQKIIDKLDE